MHTYKVKYNVEFGEFTKEELNEKGNGGCDSIIILNILGEPLNGEELSLLPLGFSGNGKQLTNAQKFVAFTLALSSLDKSELAMWQVDAINSIVQATRDNIIN